MLEPGSHTVRSPWQCNYAFIHNWYNSLLRLKTKVDIVGDLCVEQEKYVRRRDWFCSVVVLISKSAQLRDKLLSESELDKSCSP